MEYEIRQLLFDDNGKSLKQMIELQHIVYPDRVNQLDVDLFESWYINNPMGRVISFNAFYDNKIVAHYACVPVKMTIGNRVVPGLLDMATVTHPDHRGKGLFKTLARTTYDYAAKNGFEFIVGVANENSFPGYIKYFNFTFVCKLDVKWGWGRINIENKLFSFFWEEQSIKWRMGMGAYRTKGDSIVGRYRNIPFIKTFMGTLPSLPKCISPFSVLDSVVRPLNLYVGCGADLSKGFYFNFPSFITHSPFNLIFLDLTAGNLPKINKDNVLFQLIDFDVA